MTDPGGRAPLFVGLSRARFGLGMAASGLSAGWNGAFEGRALSPRKGWARLYIMDGMTRGTTQESGGWKSPAFMEAAYDKTRAKKVLPEMRAAAVRACAAMDVASFVEDLDSHVCPDGDEALGSDGGAKVRVWFYRFCSLKEYPAPIAALRIWENF